MSVSGEVDAGNAKHFAHTVREAAGGCAAVVLDLSEVHFMAFDGASALYGSDAIAGVINLRLRQARSGGSVSVTHGIYDTDVNTSRDSHHVWGEPTTTTRSPGTAVTPSSTASTFL